MRWNQIAPVLLGTLLGCSTPQTAAVPPASAPPAAAPAAAPVAAAQADATPDVPAGAAAARDAELAAQAGAIVDAFVNGDPVLTPDGKKVVFTSNRDGLPQLYVADAAKPAAPATRLVSSTERVSEPHPTADGKSVVFLSDHGADENWVIYRVGLDGKGLVALTPDEKLNRDAPFVPEAAPHTMFFSARKSSEPATTVYSASADAPGPAKTIFRDPNPGFLTDVSKDGKWGLFVRFPSQSENYLLVVDLQAGTSRTVYPTGNAKVTIHEAVISPDGRILLATDGGAEQSLLLALDSKSGKELARYVETEPATGEVGKVAVGRRGGMVAITVNAGNHSELRLLDGKTLKARRRIAMPLGLGTVGEWSRDGRRLTAAWSTPQAPGDAYVIEAASGAVAPLRKEARPSIDSLPPVESTIVEIKGFDGLKLPINLYLPNGAQGKGKKLPVIVSYHGGPAGSSAIRWSPLSRFFLAQGYVWVEPNVRGSGGFGRAYEAADNGPKRLDAFKDIEATGRWAAAQPWADPGRVVVMGGSYGGYTVLVALTRQPELWRAGVDLFGVANLKTFMATTSGIIRQIFLVEFGDPQKDAAFLETISPLADAGKIVDPLFVYAGANDPRVPRTESDQIVKAMRVRGVPVEYMVAPNEGHSLSRKENQVAFYARSARFLETHLK